MTPPTHIAREALAWLQDNEIQRVELVFSDLTSIARGKLMSTAAFQQTLAGKMPSAFFGFSVTGDEPPAVFETIFPETYPDAAMLPDWQSMVIDPLARVRTATVICDMHSRFISADGSHEIDVENLSPRQLLKRTLGRLEAAGYRAKVAPELEFFLLHPERTASGEFQIGHGMDGQAPFIESAVDMGSAEAAATFAPFFDELWAACEQQAIPISGYGHESEAGQYEVNFNPGEPLAQADAVFRFKRLARQVARRHGCYATFMAKPWQAALGNGLHWHISLSDQAGNNAFSNADGTLHPRLQHFIGGWKHSAAAGTALLAPYVNSFVRLHNPGASPASMEWGFDNRTVAFRVPHSSPENRRVEHRLPGGDANPYLTLALLLGSGLIGMQQQLDPGPDISDRSARSSDSPLPSTLGAALEAFKQCPIMTSIFPQEFIALYEMIKRYEIGQQDADPEFAFKYLRDKA